MLGVEEDEVEKRERQLEVGREGVLSPEQGLSLKWVRCLLQG